MLNTYLTQLRNLLNDTDPNNYKFSDANLTLNINLSRKKVASQGQCIRYLPPTSTNVSSIRIAQEGSGYSNGPLTVAVSAPDQSPGIQATAVAQVSGGAVVSVTMQEPGAGYFMPPSISFASSPIGVTALASGNLGYINQAYASQEKYFFSSVAMASGMDEILAVRSSTLVWGQMRYTPMAVSWSRYQALIRSYVPGILGPPGAFAQFGQGVDGSLYLYPVPDQPYQMEWDTIVLPIDLTTDTTVEAIPNPWRFCVPYFAAFVTLDGVGRYDDAKKMMDRYEMFMKQARGESQVGQVGNWYGRSAS